MTDVTDADIVAAEEQLPNLLDELKTWVNIDSGTDNKAGVDALSVLAAKRLEQSGFVVERISMTQTGDHLIGSKRGNGLLRLLLIGHMDTVFPAGAAVERPFTIRDGKAYGPGIFDMKSGILAVLTALDCIGPAAQNAYASITMMCNSDEEIGSPTSKPYIEQLARASDAVLVLEPTRSLNTVTVGRKGIAAYTLDVFGLAAHAGVMPDAGKNAILELSSLIIQLQALHKSIPTVSLNVGGVTGGGRRNVVPDRASAIFEMRAANLAAFLQAKEAIRAVINGERLVPGVTVELTQEPAEHLPLEPMEASAALIAEARAIMQSMGLELEALSIGGASDGNTTGGLGVPTLDGLGLIGQNSHNPDEYIQVDLIPQRVAFLAKLLRNLPQSLQSAQ